MDDGIQPGSIMEIAVDCPLCKQTDTLVFEAWPSSDANEDGDVYSFIDMKLMEIKCGCDSDELHSGPLDATHELVEEIYKDLA